MTLPCSCYSITQTHTNPQNTGSCEWFHIYIHSRVVCGVLVIYTLVRGLELQGFFNVKRREVPITFLYLHRSWSDKARKSHIDQEDLNACYPFCWAETRIFRVRWQWDRTLFCKLLKRKFVWGNFFTFF